MKQVAVLGSTGSIGTNCLQVLDALPERLSLAGVTAHRKWRELADQTRITHPRWAVVTDESLRTEVDRTIFSSRTELLFGESGTERLCSAPEVDVVVSAIV